MIIWWYYSNHYHQHLAAAHVIVCFVIICRAMQRRCQLHILTQSNIERSSISRIYSCEFSLLKMFLHFIQTIFYYLYRLFLSFYLICWTNIQFNDEKKKIITYKLKKKHNMCMQTYLKNMHVRSTQQPTLRPFYARLITNQSRNRKARVTDEFVEQQRTISFQILVKNYICIQSW